jgi:zinc and cadmium transporter
LLGGALLISNTKRAKLLATYATPFAAGALLAAAFGDLLPEAIHNGESDRSLQYALIGILMFFMLERFLRVFHHHHDPKHRKSDPTVSLIIIGDTLHNFIDGIAIAAGLLVDSSTGIVVTLAVAAHELPQEIGDFGLLLHKGVSRRGVLLVNVFSALATTFAAIIFYQLGQSYEVPIDVVLGLVAGFFIYIAVSDIIPSIHKAEEKKIAGPQTLLLLVGVVIVSVVTSSLHSLIDQAHGEEAGIDSHSHLEESHNEDADHHEDEVHHGEPH